jgi:hypothetical protein
MPRLWGAVHYAQQPDMSFGNLHFISVIYKKFQKKVRESGGKWGKVEKS